MNNLKQVGILLLLSLICSSYFAIQNDFGNSDDSTKKINHLVRLHIPSLFLDQFFVSYEHTISRQFSMNYSASLINNTMFPISLVGFDANHYDNGYGSKQIVTGGFIKLGVNYYFEKKTSPHSFHGRFIRPELTYTLFNKTNYIRYEWVILDQDEINVPITSDIRFNVIGLGLNYGRQFIINQKWSFAYVFGLGIGFENKVYSNPNYKTQNSGIFDGFPEYYYSHLGSKSPQAMSTINFSVGYSIK